MTSVGTAVRQRWRVRGVVQGVGFRPFVHRLASALDLAGTVVNEGADVVVDVQGPADSVAELARRLWEEAPPLARVEALEVEDADVVPDRDAAGFAIVASRAGRSGPRLVPPDVGACDVCLAEVDDPRDRRYRHPFANCTDCGPRYTVIENLPYDRPATTMSGFSMCAACAAEYEDPSDRRYHAEPVSCPACGPQLAFEGPAGVAISGTDDVLAAVQTALARSQIVAVKGIGGYHLVCDATSPTAVAALRARKDRGDKPFAVMVPDLGTARTLAALTDDEEAALRAPARPIVLARRRQGSELAPEVAPGNPMVGVMLAYTPLHHLLFQPVPGHASAPPRVVVATSGNRADEPICFEDGEARRRLGSLADAFCTHDRPIAVPCDDSVVRAVDGRVRPVRRARGFAPLPVALPVEVRPTLAVGGDLKNTFCLASGRHAWVSPHLGDAGNLETTAALERGVEALGRMLGVDPVVVAVDGHPGYRSRRWARERYADGRVELVEVQHHHAHVAAVMAEHGLAADRRVIGVTFDGTGHGRGADGTAEAWGGELLLAGYDRADRVGHLRSLPLPGGDAGVRNPCRVAVAYLAALGTDPVPGGTLAERACDVAELGVVRRQVERGVGCVPTSSMGRLFDVVASLLGVRHRVSYEAQAAIELEAVASQGRRGATPLAFAVGDDGVLDPAPLIQDLVVATARGSDAADLALGFHVAVASAVAEAVGVITAVHGSHPIALTGGVFQNDLLARLTRAALEDAGHRVLTHRLVPATDGGISLGQAVVAGRRGAAPAAPAARRQEGA